jgi:primosomal protein N' (replication factor Y) (superfamily II helicase)
VVLGSATPSIESYFNAQTGKYRLLDMPKRVDEIAMPAIYLVDMRREPRVIGSKEPIIFSQLLRQKMDEKLALGEQIILFQNRRGFATLMKCQSCGYVATCENCAISLTYHLRGQLLKCHYCGYTIKAPPKCPQCLGEDIYMKGVGTQRIEEELHRLFPGVPGLRMDLDTTRGRWGHDKILAQFASGSHRILLGTQMVAKGLDFPNVTLVGVISADSELFFPDFRAGERSFQLLTQVAGRAGRKHKTGEVIFQTLVPESEIFLFVRSHDYVRFYQHEIIARKELSYPPYSRMINILFRGPEEGAVARTAAKFAQLLSPQGIKILGPSAAQLSRLEGLYRYQILVSAAKKEDATGNKLREVVHQALVVFRKKHRIRDVQIAIDVDPVSIM